MQVESPQAAGEIAAIDAVVNASPSRSTGNRLPANGARRASNCWLAGGDAAADTGPALFRHR